MTKTKHEEFAEMEVENERLRRALVKVSDALARQNNTADLREFIARALVPRE